MGLLYLLPSIEFGNTSMGKFCLIIRNIQNITNNINVYNFCSKHFSFSQILSELHPSRTKQNTWLSQTVRCKSKCTFVERSSVCTVVPNFVQIPSPATGHSRTNEHNDINRRSKGTHTVSRIPFNTT